MSLLDKQEVAEAARKFSFALKRHGFFPTHMSEYVLAKPLQEPKAIGDHLLATTEEVPKLIKDGKWLDANFNLAFALGGAFALGLFSVQELYEVALRDDFDEEDH